MGLGHAAFDGQVQPAQTAHAAFDEGGVAIVRQHMLDPQHLTMAAPDRHHVQDEGAGDDEGFVARPIGLKMRRQSLEVGRRDFAQG